MFEQSSEKSTPESPKKPEEKKQSLSNEEQKAYFYEHKNEVMEDLRALEEKKADYDAILRDVDKIWSIAKDKEAAKKIIEEKFRPLAQRAAQEKSAAFEVVEEKYGPVAFLLGTTERLKIETREEEKNVGLEGLEDAAGRDRAWGKRRRQLQDMFGL